MGADAAPAWPPDPLSGARPADAAPAWPPDPLSGARPADAAPAWPPDPLSDAMPADAAPAWSQRSGARGGRQQIPRPAQARPGRPPRWASLDPDERTGISLDRVRNGFDRRGWSGPDPKQVPPARLARHHEPDARPAAVLCAVFEEAGEAHVILTRRSSNLRSHTGEVSFPGGRLEPGEPAVDGALREASEEVGIDPAAIEILGPLSPLVTVRNLVLITPVVGVLPGRPALLPNPAEVERAFDVSLAELVSDGVYREELWRIPDEEDWRSISFFELPGDTVWGATAWMLCDLLDLTLIRR